MADAKSPLSNAEHKLRSFEAALGEISPLFNFANKAPIFFELSSISRFLAGFACGPPKALEVSSKRRVRVFITGLISAETFDVSAVCRVGGGAGGATTGAGCCCWTGVRVGLDGWVPLKLGLGMNC